MVCALFALTRVLLVAATLAVAPLTRPSILSQPTRWPLWHTWLRWDAVYYAQIAAHGYAAAQAQTTPAFFPLFPLLMRVTQPFTGGDLALAGLLDANIAWLVALWQLYLFTAETLGHPAARGAVFALSVFPAALFGFVAYPEALYLALAIAALRAMRGKHWWLAALLGMLAALTRQSGLLLVLPWLWEYGAQIRWRWRRVRPDLLLALAIPAGTALFALVLWRAVGDPLAFLHAQRSWHRGWAWPWQTIWWGAQALTTQPMRYFTWRAWQEFLTVLAMIGLAGVTLFFVWSPPPSWREQGHELPVSAACYVVPLLALFLAQPANDWPLLSQSRFALELFPLFVTLGAIIATNRWYTIALVVVCLPLQLALLAIFSRGGWVL